MRRIEVRADPGRAFTEQAGVTVGGVQKVVQQLAAHALFGLARGPPGEQEQGGDHGGPLQGALVDRVEGRVTAQNEGAQDLTARPDRRDPLRAVPYGVAVGAGAVQRRGRCPAGLGELHLAVQDFRHRVRHVLDPAAAQYQFGQPVVDVRGALDDRAAVADDLVGRLQFGERLTGLGEEVGGVDGDGGVRRVGGEQGDLAAFEDPLAAVGGEEHADHAAAEHQGHAEDRHQTLVMDARVDGAGVPEPLVVEVAVGDIRAGGLRDQPAQAFAHAEPQLLEPRGDRAVGDPHIGVAERRGRGG